MAKNEYDQNHDVRMTAISDLAMEVAEDVWTEDEPTLAEYELAQAIVDRTLSAAREVLAEYERSCDPAPFTNERALYERLRHAIPPGGSDA